MAGLGRKVFNAGEVLSAANVQGYLQDQVVQVYAGTAARSSALGTAVSEGMVSYRTDDNALEVYTSNGTAAWSPVNLAQSPNYLINSNHDIWQRGSAVSIAAVSNTYTADRWVTTLNQRTSGTLVVRQNTADKQSTDNYCLEIDATGVVTTSVLFHTQILETKDVVPLRGKTVTLSFYAKVSSGSGTYLAVVRDGTDTDSFPLTSSTQTETSNTVTTSWQRFTVTHTVQAGANSICVRFTTPSAFAGKVFFSQVQLEAGAVATPFRRNAPSIQAELAACQRYFRRISGVEGAIFGAGMAISTTNARIPLPSIMQMRTAPTVSFSASNAFRLWDGAAGTYATTSMAADAYVTSESVVSIYPTVSSGLTQYRPYLLIPQSGGATSYIDLTSEL